jgi:type IV pilus assembly protein PilN
MVRINLLPIREILRKRELKQFAVLSVAILVTTLLISGLSWLFFDWKQRALEDERKAQSAKLAALKKKNAEIEELKTRITRLQRQVDTIQKLTKTRDTPAPFLQAVSLAIPDEVWVMSVSKSGRNFSVDGIGLDNTVVVNFVQRLQRIREGFTEKQPFLEPNAPSDNSFFSDVKLVQIVSAGSQARGGGLGTMSFKIVGNLR